MKNEDSAELESLKYKIKLWESEFYKNTNEKPTKEDINNASPDIKESYKKYWKLKKSESTIINNIKDVWSVKLNKSNFKMSNKKLYQSSLKGYCNKIKENSFISTKDEKFITAKKKLSTKKSEYQEPRNYITDSTIKLESNELEKSIYNKDASICCEKSNMQESLLDIDCLKKAYKCHSEIDTISTEIKTSKACLSINLVSQSIGIAPSSKSLKFDKNLNIDWLERCDSNILCTFTDNKHIEISNELPALLSPSNKLNKSYESRDEVDQISSIPESIQSDTVCIENVGNKTNSEKFVSNTLYSAAYHLCEHISDSIGVTDYSKKFNEKKIEVNEIQSNCSPMKKRKLKISPGTYNGEDNMSRKLLNLKRKISSGTLNENFVRLDIKKKKFSRGHKSVNVKKLKWNKWKQMKKSSGTDQTNITGCFKCGQFGHWAKNCNAVSYSKKDVAEEFKEEHNEDITLPTLDEAAKLIKEKFGNSTKYFADSTVDNESCGIVDFSIFSEVDNAVLKGVVEPLFKANENVQLADTPKAVFEALEEMGYSSFREGQEVAVMRILSGLSTLVVLPTGSGKSLCYQLPAYLYFKERKSIALVISPLVSLMEDQVIGLPQCLHAVCLHSGMSDVLKDKAMDDIISGKAQIVLLSPEAVIHYRFCDKFINSNMPAISFACIDEVHCLSQWSHNFRPSYLQLFKVLTRKLGVKCLLGLTATATRSVVNEISIELDLVSLENSVIGYTKVPHNLHCSISKDKDKDKALIQVLSGEHFRNCSSIIIYCIRRIETERLAALIRTCMQDETESSQVKNKSKTKKRTLIWTAEAYHAGLAPPKRRSIQKKFMSGKIKIVVATIAFGMGLDKSDVRAIIHYNMPKSFESYVQEIGRAGRDGLDSYCHLFLDNEKNDLWEQERHIYSNGIDRHTLRKLLKRVFLSSKSNLTKLHYDSEMGKSESVKMECSTKHEVAFPINDTVQELDLKQEIVSTLLCYLELHPKKWIEILTPTYSTCTISCYGGPALLHKTALKNPMLAIAITSISDEKSVKSSQYSFEIVKLAAAIKCKSSVLKHELKKLEWEGKRKTGILVELSNLAFHILAPTDLPDDEMDLILDFLHHKVLESENSQLRNLRLLYSTFQKYSFSHYWQCCDELNTESSEKIKGAIEKYFNMDKCEELKISELKDDESIGEDILYVKQLIREFISIHHDQNFTARSIARIFHGISSPCFPAEVWSRVYKFWRCLLPVNFNILMKLANEELRKFKTT